ncbi:hypothetical protein BDZ85DRAFT_100691 [Elsinoe ampelina]|uniref:Uncharacterized protein n=1 Tax=Elsinoe ampelina TaxID=302913 RepID=A0A6A6GF68_9PEZI|nr:hypothetical protein BDZ85DRAFT_100691 [Elsinoe ampelina]
MRVPWHTTDKAVRPKSYSWMSKPPDTECWSSNPACVASRSFPSRSLYTTTMHLCVLTVVAKDAPRAGDPHRRGKNAKKECCNNIMCFQIFPVCCVTEVVHGGCTGATYHFTVAPSGLPRGRTWCDGK